MRGAPALSGWEVNLAGLGMARIAIDVFATPKAFGAGATRLVTTRGETFCAVALLICPEEVWMVAESAAINQNAENLECFIKCSAH
jgi:hypothetical protein